MDKYDSSSEQILIDQMTEVYKELHFISVWSTYISFCLVFTKMKLIHHLQEQRLYIKINTHKQFLVVLVVNVIMTLSYV